MTYKKLLPLMLAALLLAGCSSETPAETAAATADAAAAAETPAAETNVKMTPDRRAEVSGVVKNIVGNEVSVNLLLKDNTAQQAVEAVELTEEEKAAKQAENQAKRASGGTGSGMAEAELSGETVDLVIPVGTPILSSSGTGDLVAVNIADIGRGDTVKIWLLEGGEGEAALAETVQILTR